MSVEYRELFQTCKKLTDDSRLSSLCDVMLHFTVCRSEKWTFIKNFLTTNGLQKFLQNL